MDEIFSKSDYDYQNRVDDHIEDGSFDDNSYNSGDLSGYSTGGYKL